MAWTKGNLCAASVALFSCLPVDITVAADLPTDVATFVEERQQCDHFRGEEAYDEARAKEIDAALDRYCVGTDARLAELKAKYSEGPVAVISVLGEFEDKIE